MLFSVDTFVMKLSFVVDCWFFSLWKIMLAAESFGLQCGYGGGRYCDLEMLEVIAALRRDEKCLA